MDRQKDSTFFLAALTLALIAASIWTFSSYLHYILVGSVLALATSHAFNGLVQFLETIKNKRLGVLRKNKNITAASALTCFFLTMIFGPLLFFVSVTYDKASALDLDQIKQTLLDIFDRSVDLLNKIPLLQEPLARLKSEGVSFISGPALEAAFTGIQGIVAGAGSLLVQIVWIMLFYFLFNFYGKSILRFLASLIPMSSEHKEYLYRECTGTVAVVFYGTLFNMAAQGIAFGILMAFIQDYDAVYLGVMAGFCSVIPLIGAALVYVPVIVLELMAGHYITAVVILIFTWVVMGFLIDNILRLIFISFLKKLFGFEYTMNEILILLAILAGIASFGFWGLIIGPSVLALTLAAANLYSSQIKEG